MASMAGETVLSGDLAYVAADAAGLRVVDVSDGAHPQEIGVYNTPEGIDVALANGAVYVADGFYGLWLVDISELPNLGAMRRFEVPGNALGVDVAGEYVFVAAYGSGLWIASISPSSGLAWANTYGDLGCANDVAVAGKYAYTATDTGLAIVDISDPAAPWEAGRYITLDRAINVTVVGNYAYVTVADASVRVVDVSDPTDPTELVSYKTWGQPWDITIMGDCAYLTDIPELGFEPAGGLRVLDISDPSGPLEVGFCATPGNGWGITSMGNLAYVADGEEGGLRVIDASDPSAPTEIGSYDTPGRALAVAAAGNHVFVADDDGGLHIFQVPALPHPWPMEGHDAQRTGHSPYRGPSSPALEWTFEGHGALSSPVIAVDGTVYVMASDGWLYALSVAGEARTVAHFEEDVAASLLLDEDGNIYVAAGTFLYAFGSNETHKWALDLKERSRQLLGVGERILVFGSDHLVVLQQDKSIEAVCPFDAFDFSVDRSGKVMTGNGYKGLIALDPLTCQVHKSLDCQTQGGCLGSWIWIASGPEGKTYIHVMPHGVDGTMAGVDYLWVIGPSGQEEWTYPRAPLFSNRPQTRKYDGVHRSPALGEDGSAYLGLGEEKDGSRSVGAIAPDGALRWSFEVDSEVSDIVLGDDVIYAITESGRLYALDAAGNLKWTFNVGEAGSLAIGNTTVYVASGNRLYAIGQAAP